MTSLRLEVLEDRTVPSITATDTGTVLEIVTDANGDITMSASGGVLTLSSPTHLINGTAAVGGVSTVTFDLADFDTIFVNTGQVSTVVFNNVEIRGSAAFANENIVAFGVAVDVTSGPLSVNGLMLSSQGLGVPIDLDQQVTSTGAVSLHPLSADVVLRAPIVAPGQTVSLVSGVVQTNNYTVTQTAAGVITADALYAEDGGGVALSASNQISRVAGKVFAYGILVDAGSNPPGDFAVNSTLDLTAGTVSSGYYVGNVSGVATTNGSVTLATAAGRTITVDEAVTAGGTGKTATLAADAFDLDAANAIAADNVVLQSAGSGANITLGGAGLTNAELDAISATNLTIQASGTVGVSSAVALGDDVSRVVTLRGASVNFADRLSANSGTGVLRVETDSLGVLAGGTQLVSAPEVEIVATGDITFTASAVFGGLDFSQTDLNALDETTVRTLRFITTGGITFANGPVNFANSLVVTSSGVVALKAGGAISDATGSSVAATALAAVGGSVALDSAGNAIGTLAGSASVGDFVVRSGGNLTIGAVDVGGRGVGAAGVTASSAPTPRDIEITASGTLAVANAVQSSAGDVTLAATGAGSDVAYGGSGFSNALFGTVTVQAGGAVTHAGSGDDIRASAVVLDAAAGVGTGAAPIDIGAGSVNASNTTSGDVVLRLNSNGGFSTTNASVINTAATGNVAVTRQGGTQLAVTSATTTNGSVTLGTNGAGLSLTGVSAGGANHDVTATTAAAGNIAVGGVAATRRVTLTAGGAITDDGNAATVVSSPSLALTAATGLGTVAAPLNTDVDTLEATTGTGGVFVGNDGALTIGGVNGTLTGVRVTGASGAIGVVATGTITVNEGVQAPGDVALSATIDGSDIVTQGGSGNAVASSGGTTTLRAGGNLTLGTATGSGDVRGQGLVLEAGGDIVLDNQTSAESTGAAGVTATAGGDVKILRALGAGSKLNSTSGGAPVSITAGSGRAFVLDQGLSGGVGASGGGIAINADDMTLTSGRIGTTGTVTLAPVTFLRTINLGTEVAGSLSLTDAELDLVAADTLVIGSSAPTVGAAGVTVSADLTRPAATNIELVSGSVVQNSGGGSIDTAGGTLSMRGTSSPGYSPDRTGPDAVASVVSFDAGRNLFFTLGGTTPDAGYTQLSVQGAVNLAGTNLVLRVPGSIVPSTGDAFTIVSATSRTGTFNGYGENSTIVFRGVTLRVNYTATTVTLTAIGAPTADPRSLTLGQDSTGVAVTLTGSDPNSPALPLTFAVTDPPDHGTLSGTAPNLAYTPDPGYSGPDSFRFTTNNGFVDSTEATVALTVAPPPTVASAAAPLTNASPIPVTVTFSEAVTGFDVSDVLVGNGTVTNFAGSGTTYTFDVEPTGQGAVTVDVGAGAGQYASGNGTPAAAQLVRTYDSQGPTVAISAPVAVAQGTIEFTVTYTDVRFAASTLGTGDITLSRTGSVTGTVSVSGSGNTRTVRISGITGVGNLSISLAAGTASDTLGNLSPAAEASASFAASRRFDMKSSGSAQHSAGWDRVLAGTRYSVATGYGWATTGSVGGSTGGKVPPGGDAKVLGDYAYGVTPVAFKVFVGAGQSATVTVHTHSAPTQGLQGVKASVTVGTTQTLRGNGTLTVSGTAGADGVLTVTFSVAPGSSMWIVNALEVTPGIPV